MKSVLAYGDSLTFGANPTGGPRHPHEDRWPSVLEQGLGGGTRVIAEGLGGRTTVFDDYSSGADRNGARILPTLLASHAPLDLVIVMLGTNDLKPSINGRAQQASYGMRRLVQIVRGHFAGLGEPVPEVLLVAPPHLCDTTGTEMLEHFGGLEHGLRESQSFELHYRRRAEESGVPFFDAATVAKADPADGVHLDAENTRAIGTALVPVVKSILRL